MGSLFKKNKVIGQVYLSGIDGLIWEVGFVFNDVYQKQGYATEAVNTVLKDVFHNQNAHRVFAECNPKNESSWRLLERIGFKKEGCLRQNIYFNKNKYDEPIWQDTYIYGLLSSDYIF